MQTYNCSHALCNQLRYENNLHKRSDYRAGINTYDFYNPDSSACKTRTTQTYEPAAFILGYKRVIHFSNEEKIRDLAKNHPKLVCALTHSAQYYANLPGNDFIMYTPSGRYKALYFLENTIDATIRRFYPTNESSALDRIYTFGTCMDYAEEDIRFFLQRQAYTHIYGKKPENEYNRIAQFKQFLKKWNKDELDHYLSRKKRIDEDMQHDSIDKIEQRINTKINQYAHILGNVSYDNDPREYATTMEISENTAYKALNTIAIPGAPSIPEKLAQTSSDIIRSNIEPLEASSLGEMIYGEQPLHAAEQIINQEVDTCKKLREWATYLQTVAQSTDLSEDVQKKINLFLNTIISVLDLYDEPYYFSIDTPPQPASTIFDTTRKALQCLNISDISIHTTEIELRRMRPQSQDTYHNLQLWEQHLRNALDIIYQHNLTSKCYTVLEFLHARIEHLISKYETYYN